MFPKEANSGLGGQMLLPPAAQGTSPWPALHHQTRPWHSQAPWPRSADSPGDRSGSEGPGGRRGRIRF